MKRMCKFIFGIIFSIFMMGIISCSGQDESTNLTIAIDMSGLLPSNESKDSFARSVDDEKWKLEVTLIDLEDENNILPLTISVPIIDNKASVTFEKIPLFFKGRIEAIIFEGETPKFTGKSEEFIVHEGRNRISVHMEEVDNPTEPGDPEDPADPNDPNQPGDGTGEGSGDTGGDEPTEPGNPTEPENPTEPDDPGDDPAIGETEKTANYTVKHYQQNIDDDGYTLVETDTEVKTGIVGAETSAEAKKYEGFEVYSVEQKTIAEDGTTEVQIKYNRKVITLTFDTDGGSSVETIIGRYGATVVAPENPTKNGYTFTAWNPTLPETFPSADSEYKATWIKEGDYTITYNLDGGTNANENPISYNVETETITLKEPTKIGYSFEGWKDEEGTTITEITKGSTGNIILTAVWKANTDTVYTVEHWQQNAEGDGYTLYLTEEKNGTTGTQTTVTAKEYEGFEEGVVEQKTIAADGSTEIKIYYDRNCVTLTFDTDGGSSVESIIGRYGATVVAPENPTKNGYTFTAWNPTLPKTFPSTDSEYKAIWIKEGDYAITYNLDGGTNANENPISYNVETETITLKEPTKIGYSFEGWKDEEGTTITEITKGSTGNITLTAKWTPITYEITYDLVANDVKNPNTVTKYTIESETIVLQSPTRTGYSFEGWKNTAGEIVTQITKGSIGNVSLTAQWKKIEYELTITIPSYSDLNEFKITENNSTLSVEIPDGYTIEGWYVNGQEIDSPKNNEGNEITEGITSNQLGIEEGGIYTIMIIVKETNGTKLYSAECQLEVTK